MENTGKILFKNDPQSEWFVAQNGQSLGPMSALEVYERIQSGDFSWVSFAWKDGMSDWKRISEISTFQKAMPGAPTLKPKMPKKGPPPPPASDEGIKDWYLHMNDSQYGPFSVAEIESYLRLGKLHGKVYAWKDGQADWKKLNELPEFKKSVKVASQNSSPLIEKLNLEFQKTTGLALESQDRRVAPRVPLVARLMVAGKNQLTLALCRDISVGGMQVLTDQVPGPVGTKLKLNVSPAGKGKKLDAFIAEGEIVRILEDGRGYSFRFTQLAPAARKSIESYIQSTGKGK